VLAAALAAPARADGPPSYLFGGRTIVMSHTVVAAGGVAVGVDDPGLLELLANVGAALTYTPGNRYVLITTAEPQVISFAIGDKRYDIGSNSSQAPFAPFERNGIAYVPLDELLHALYLAVKRDGNVNVIQPQLAVVDVQSNDGRATVIARGGVPLHARLISETPDQLIFAFDGVGTTLQHTRGIRAAGLRQLEVAQSGDARSPVTTVTLDEVPGASHGVADSDDGRDFTISFTGPQSGAIPIERIAPPVVTVPSQLPTQEPTDVPTSAPAGGPATITAIDARSGSDGLTIDVTVNGDASYEWHRLREPDNRFWIDLHDATLAMPERDDLETGPATALRTHQIDASTVRLALSLAGPQRLDVEPTSTGIHIVIYPDTVSDTVARAGTGTVGTVALAANPNPAVSPTPLPSGDAWKFAPHAGYVARNPRLIAIDPGHGGSDPGVVKGGTREANLTLDIARRLRDILLARGWQVVMTRNSDVDVIAPYDSGRVELQGRDDVANKAGARLFVSVHVNSYLNPGPNGTTTYYSKPADVPLARAVSHRAAVALGTKDDGIVKNDLYVTLHATMPAILVEAAFLSNPSDFALLTSTAWRQKAAQAIADGIADYAGAPPPAAQTGNQ